ncbi:hypothetical protein KKH18_09590 [bacterium]|nr:hypothetical protein [bacterium]
MEVEQLAFLKDKPTIKQVLQGYFKVRFTLSLRFKYGCGFEGYRIAEGSELAQKRFLIILKCIVRCRQNVMPLLAFQILDHLATANNRNIIRIAQTPFDHTG